MNSLLSSLIILITDKDLLSSTNKLIINIKSQPFQILIFLSFIFSVMFVWQLALGHSQ